jgi:hypothetical protein
MAAVVATLITRTQSTAISEDDLVDASSGLYMLPAVLLQDEVDRPGAPYPIYLGQLGC